MFRKKEIAAILILVIFCISSVWAEEQKTRTVQIRDARTGKMLAKQVPITTPTKSSSCENTSVLIEYVDASVPCNLHTCIKFRIHENEEDSL